MSIIKAIKQQLGLSVTPANNFTLDASADNGSMKLARNSGQDIMTVDAAGKPRFPQLAQLPSSNGYKVLEGGLIIQWGNIYNDNSQGTGVSAIFYPIPFPNAVFVVQVEAEVSAAAGLAFYSARSKFGVTALDYALVAWYGANNALTTDAAAGSWIAIGY